MMKNKISAKRIIISVLISVAVITLILVVMYIFAWVIPHEREFTYFSEVSGKNEDFIEDTNEFKYHYVAIYLNTECYIDSNVELDIPEEGKPLKLKTDYVGMRKYIADTMGAYITSPILVFEVVN